jgi:hypothetical protein
MRKKAAMFSYVAPSRPTSSELIMLGAAAQPPQRGRLRRQAPVMHMNDAHLHMRQYLRKRSMSIIASTRLSLLRTELS